MAKHTNQKKRWARMMKEITASKQEAQRQRQRASDFADAAAQQQHRADALDSGLHLARDIMKSLGWADNCDAIRSIDAAFHEAKGGVQ
jgi:hypothetical protein